MTVPHCPLHSTIRSCTVCMHRGGPDRMPVATYSSGCRTVVWLPCSCDRHHRCLRQRLSWTVHTRARALSLARSCNQLDARTSGTASSRPCLYQHSAVLCCIVCDTMLYSTVCCFICGPPLRRPVHSTFLHDSFSCIGEAASSRTTRHAPVPVQESAAFGAHYCTKHDDSFVRPK